MISVMRLMNDTLGSPMVQIMLYGKNNASEEDFSFKVTFKKCKY